ncbi:MAG: heavy metal translocating P-type ATPase [Candidatus Faecenecus gallistercoris]|nr:cadmium-translocating P-type ATPase [Bacillota bacterium]MDD7101924.1 heavy metal translocating P-type ATPase [Bacillota bacterium]MDY4050968.1 heavy metal translocating P-type ATPase [Candidatus Faecenecus gallistercoris]
MKKKLIFILVALVLFVGAFLCPAVLQEELPILQTILFVLAYLLVGFEVLKKAFRNLLKGHVFDENFLMSVATLGAFGIGELEEAVAVMLFYQVGEFFQSYAVDKSRKSVAALMDIRPDYANVYRNGEIVKVNPDDVNIGEMILVKPGEKVPLDCTVVAGDGMLNTLALTGEATPRHVGENDSVLSGSISIDGTLKLKVDKEFGESTVSKILELVENASSRKSKSENFISKFARYYTPIVVGIAVLLAFVPPLFLGWNTFSTWIYRALSFLVVSCPCALVISIPLSFFAGIGASAKRGILIKGSNYLEALSKTKMIVCDKTGTLTEGVFQVQEVDAIGYSDAELLKFAAYAEYYSNHPISLSLRNAYGKDIDEALITKNKEFSGKGVESIVDGKKVLVGNEKLMTEKKISITKNEKMGTIVYVAIDGKFVGSIVIADKIKEDAYVAMKRFRDYSIDVVMLTGDRENISQSVANELGITRYHSELLPQQKVELTQKYMNEKEADEKLVFIGDGINDAPVLAYADIGCSMGGLGSDAAIEAADVVIMTDQPSLVADAISISRKTMRIVTENIVFAIAVKVLVLLLSAIGVASMWAAVFADVGVSVIAILNALRILRIKK